MLRLKRYSLAFDRVAINSGFTLILSLIPLTPFRRCNCPWVPLLVMWATDSAGPPSLLQCHTIEKLQGSIIGAIIQHQAQLMRTIVLHSS